MDIKLLIAILGAVVGVFGAVVAYTKFLAQQPLEAKIIRLDAELKRKDQELDQKAGDLVAKEAQLTQLKDEYTVALQEFLQYKGGRGGALIKREIDNELTLIRNALGATESSVLVPGPLSYSPSFVFLSIYGPAAARLRKTKLPIDKGIVGRVFRSGLAINSIDPYGDASFSAVADRKGDHVTQSMLTVPIDFQGQVVGVAQFLNKADGSSFTDVDERVALSAVQNIAPKVSEFMRDAANFETLGLAATASQGRSSSVLFCDLTASSSMLEAMGSAEAIDAINEYLECQAEIALGYGGAIDKYLGDGAMFVFNASRSSVDPDYAVKGVQAGVNMQQDFQRLKRSWLELGMPVSTVHNRVAVACGPVLLPVMGHPQFKQLTVFGNTVGRAAHLCEVAPRDRDILLVDEHVMSQTRQSFGMHQLAGLADPRLAGRAYEVNWRAASDRSRSLRLTPDQEEAASGQGEGSSL